MRYLSIDYGRKRIGIALSDESGEFALPKAVLPNEAHLLKRLKGLCDEYNVGAIVIGESLDFTGRPNPIQRQILKFKQNIEGFLKLPVYLEPEFLTSKEAQRVQGETPLHDASAAALILKSFLEKQKEKIQSEGS